MRFRIELLLILFAVLIPLLPRAQDDPSGEVKIFVNNFFAQWSQPNVIAIPYVANAVTDPVNFYGKPTSRKDFEKIQIAFAVRWPLRAYSIEPGTLLISCNSDQNGCVVSGIVDWVDSSPSRNATSKGSAAFNFIIQLPEANSLSPILITFEDGHVISRTISPYQSTPTGGSNTNVASAPPVLDEAPPSVPPASVPPPPVPPASAPQPAPEPSFGNTIPDSALASDQLKVTSWSTEWAVAEQTDSGVGLCVPIVRLTLENLGADLSSASLQVQFVNMANKTIYGEGVGFTNGIPSGFSSNFIIDGDTGQPVDGLGCFSPPLLTAIVKISDFPAGSGQDLLIASGLVDPGLGH